MVSIKSYPSTKASNVVWVGEIPDTWQIHQGKRIFRNRREPADKHDMQLAASQKYGVIPQEQMMKLNDSKVMLALKGTESFRHVEQDDFVISLRSFEGGIEHSDFQGCVSPAYTVLSASKKLVPKYFKYLFKSQPYISALQASTDSLRDGKSISYEQFGSIPLILPPVTEQAQITFFLDRETAKTDRLIEKQQRLIELLEEKRQAVISHAVTKGLNPDAPMKDSGVEWLGEVPEHWKIKPLKYVARIKNGKDYKDVESDSVTGFPVIGSGGQFTYSNQYMFNGESVLFGRKGTIDKPLYFNGPFWTVDTMFYTQLKSGNLAKYLYFVALTIPFGYYSTSTALPSMTQEDLGNHDLAVPSYAEQLQVVEYLGNELTKLEKLKAKAKSAISLMQERRTALISAAVTGKIDVRDQVPQDVEEAVAS